MQGNAIATVEKSKKDVKVTRTVIPSIYGLKKYQCEMFQFTGTGRTQQELKKMGYVEAPNKITAFSLLSKNHKDWGVRLVEIKEVDKFDFESLPEPVVETTEEEWVDPIEQV